MTDNQVAFIIQRQIQFKFEKRAVNNIRRNEREKRRELSAHIEDIEHQIGYGAIGAEPRRPKAVEHDYERRARILHEKRIKAQDKDRNDLFRDTNDKRKREETREERIEAQIERISDRQRRCEMMVSAAEERQLPDFENDKHNRRILAPFDNLPVIQYLEQYDDEVPEPIKTRCSPEIIIDHANTVMEVDDIREETTLEV